VLTSLAHALVSHPWVYDKVQFLAGGKHVLRRLKPVLAETEGDTVLDVGGGTGNATLILPSLHSYICLDNDPMKLLGLKRKQLSLNSLLGDATSMPVRDKSVDDVLCLNVLHHLTDDQVASFLREAARVARKRFIVMDPLDRPHSFVSRTLWRYDRGSHPRSKERLRSFLESRFKIERTENFAVYHEYLICVCRPLDVS
jgi:ubiquinone/menaquinone biosynthesis C-methylase UbiE